MISQLFHSSVFSNSSFCVGDLCPHPCALPCIGILDRIPVFATLSREVRDSLLSVMRPKTFSSGDYICRQGDKGYRLHVIIKGHARVTVNDPEEEAGERTLTTLSSPEYFGEIALLSEYLAIFPFFHVLYWVPTLNYVTTSTKFQISLLPLAPFSLIFPLRFAPFLLRMCFLRRGLSPHRQCYSTRGRSHDNGSTQAQL